MTDTQSGGQDLGSIYVDGVKVWDTTGNWIQHMPRRELTFHQPKKPPIPEDAVVLADYMLMADFVAQSTTTLAHISKGVRTCSISRDVFPNAPSGHSWNFSQDVAYYNGWALYGSADANGTNYTYRLPSFCTNWVVRSNHSQAITLYNGSSAGSTQTAGTANTQGSYRYLNTDLTLGLQNSGWNPNSGQNPTSSAIEFATPTHTSSHYQSFETPFLKELVGGDRNMEQHNLIVTPDGKSWNEVTRDTSYIGNVVLSLSPTQTDTNDYQRLSLIHI